MLFKQVLDAFGGIEQVADGVVVVEGVSYFFSLFLHPFDLLLDITVLRKTHVYRTEKYIYKLNIL